MITMHIALLGIAILLPVLIIGSDPGFAVRSLGSLGKAIWPFAVIGVVSLCILCGYGIPIVEWVIPTMSLMACWLFVRTDRMFRYTRSGLLILTLALLVNWGYLVPTGEYTSAPKMLSMFSSRECVAEWHTILTGLYRVN